MGIPTTNSQNFNGKSPFPEFFSLLMLGGWWASWSQARYLKCSECEKWPLGIFFGRPARWALSSYKWSYNPYKWPYKWLTVLITLVIGVINPVITGRGPTLWWFQSFFFFWIFTPTWKNDSIWQIFLKPPTKQSFAESCVIVSVYRLRKKTTSKESYAGWKWQDCSQRVTFVQSFELKMGPC